MPFITTEIIIYLSYIKVFHSHESYSTSISIVFRQRFVRIHTSSSYTIDTRLITKPTSPSFIPINFRFHKHVGVLVRLFQGVTLSFQSSVYQFYDIRRHNFSLCNVSHHSCNSDSIYHSNR